MNAADEKINVLNVLPLGGVGGAENFVLSLCRHHDRTRFDVRVCILFSGETVARKIVDEGIEVTRLQMKNGFDVKRAATLVKLIRKERIDIVNIHGQNPLGKLFSLLGRPPLIIHTDHGTSIGSPVKRRKRVVLFNRLFTPFIDHFIAISEGMKRSLQLREKVPESKISLIYNGIDIISLSGHTTHKPDLCRSIGINPGYPVIGTIGRISAEKRYPILIKTVECLVAQGITVTALIVGDGPLKNDLKALIAHKNLTKQVRLLGERSDVGELLDMMDVFVFPSGGEGFSITILEAMAKSKPVVAFNVDGVKEAVIDGKTGFLVQDKNLEDFVSKVRWLIKNPPYASKMGHEGQLSLRNKYDIKNNIATLESIYIRLIRMKKSLHSVVQLKKKNQYIL